MVVFGQKWLYSGKRDCNRTKSACIRAKVVALGICGCIQERVVAFGQIWLYSGKMVVFGQNWLFSGKVVVFGQVDEFG